MRQTQGNGTFENSKTASVTLLRSHEKSGTHSLLRLGVVLALSIFISEALIMVGLSFLPFASPWIRVILDPSILLLFLLPVLYFFIFRRMALQISKEKAVEAKLLHLNSILRAIRDINQVISRESDLQTLLKEVCRILVESRGFNNAWIALFDESWNVNRSAEAGLGDAFLPVVDLFNQGKLTMCGTKALARNGVAITEDPIETCIHCPLAGCYDKTWGLTARLEHSGTLYGLITVSLAKRFSDYEEEETLLAETADDIALAIHNLELEEERRKKEETLRISKERYSALVEESFDGIFVQKGSKIIFANRRLHDMLGYDAGGLLGLDHWLIYHPEYQALTRKRARARMQGEKTTTHYEVKMQRKDGSWFYAEIAARVIEIEKEAGIQVWIRDITDRKQAEMILQESEARLRNLFEASPLGIGLVKKRRMQWHNKTMYRMLGYSLEELQEKDARMLYESDEAYEHAGNAINSLGPEKTTTDIETRWVRKDGSVFDCHIRYALQNPDAEEKVVIAMAEDITEKKRAEEKRQKLQEQLNHAQKMEAIGTLAGGVAHDFNNLLTVIIGNADLALMNLDKDTSFYNAIEEIGRAGHRAAALTRQLLAFSRKELIRPEILDINGVTMNLEKMLRRIIGEDVELVPAYASEPCLVEIDPGQIEQVIMNLSVNARDAMPTGGKLTIGTGKVELDDAYFQAQGTKGKAGPYVMLAVTDSGIGMDRETRARVFDPFFTTKEMGRGTGLGLSMVYGIIKQNNGHIWVHSEEGKGTTFKVYLPEVESNAEGERKREHSKTPLKGFETIIVTEDDDLLRHMTKKMLEGYGYRTIIAENGREAMEIVKTHDGPIDLLITDVVMPGMSGRDLVEQLQGKIPGIKVLYMSGYTGNAIAHHGVLDKNVNFIQKPFTRESLAKKVRQVLDDENE